MSPDTSFHPGELRVQRRAGTRGVADELSRALNDHLPEGGALNSLLHKLRFLALTSVGPATAETPGHSVWVSIMFGQQFVHSASSDKLSIRLDGLPRGDVLYEHLARSEKELPVSIVALHMMSRRRYRTNGVVTKLPDAPAGPRATLEICVQEAFPNCPKYIQARDVTQATSSLPPVPESAAYETDDSLSEADKALIGRADALWIGTYYEASGADTNHRGGRAGFVRVASSKEIFWPEYRGNGMFQSSGNLQVDDRAGVSFVDFDTGHTVQLSGRASIEWDVDAALHVEKSAVRLTRFRIAAVRRSRGPATNYRWTSPEYSPYSPMLPRQDGGAESTEKYPMRVSLVKVTEESAVVKTFRFVAPERIPFLPGQYASFDFGVMPEIWSDSEPIIRTWTLSEVANSTEGDVTLEVSVKRKAKGVMSNWLHDHAKVGLQVKLLGTGGDMTPFNAGELAEKMLLISGGIGITPNMAILRGIGARSDPARSVAPDIVMVHQERDEDDMPFKDELHRRVRASRGRTKLIKLISGKEVAGEKDGGGDESEGIERYSGRVEKEFLVEHVPDVASRVVYLCGPAGFMESVKSMLSSLNVPSDRVVTEEFNF